MITALAALLPVVERGHELLVAANATLLDAYAHTHAAYRDTARLLGELRRRASTGGAAVPLPEIRGVDEAEVRRIIDSLSRGAATKNIARDLGVTPRTIEKRIANLKEATGSRTMFELGVAAADAGWIPIQASERAD